MTMIFETKIHHQDGSIKPLIITSIHAIAFDIDEHLAPDLIRAYSKARQIEQNSGNIYTDLERVECMASNVKPKNMRVTFRQCHRWHLLISALAEISWMDTQFENQSKDFT